MTDADGTWADESDWELVDSEAGADVDGADASGPPPVVAVVGRPKRPCRNCNASRPSIAPG